MTLTNKEAYLAATTQDFKLFAIQTLKELHPNTEFLDNWHIDAIIHLLEESIEGRMPRIVINMPPRQLKSVLISIAFPAFLLALDPSTRIICVSYGDDLARDHARKTRRILQSAWYQKLFPHVKLLKTSETEIETDQGGGRFATSVGGSLTGKGGDFIIVDDPSKPVNIGADITRTTTNDWYRNTLLSRLDDKKYGVLILVMQRLHVNDLTGFIEGDASFHKLSLSAIATRTETIATRFGNSYTRQPGEPLHPERESLQILHGIRDQMGTFLFSAQYQQNPETPEGGMFKAKYFQIVDSHPVKTQYGYYCVSIDCAISTSDQADFTAITFAYVSEGDVTVLQVKRGRWFYEEIRQIALDYDKTYGNKVFFLIEAANVGLSLIACLREKQLNALTYKPVDSKLGRAAVMLPEFEAKKVHLLRIKGKDSWITPLINEFVSFPGCRYDDQVDSLVQLVWFAKRTPYPGGRCIVC